MHIAQHLSFFGWGLLFSWSMLRPGLGRQLGASALAIFTTAMHTGVLGALRRFAPTAW